ncbi:TetR/AcrR family transcriptional regulator [Selenihalanaerobacter shriftii]|uniref:Transcriptional regulator, TetR family n=1 Tax=Selenihalanaerobacter shriftii TaxID=142842 RepID=A0A1T4JJP0_9FIRM|nr:TetR/AcrR family transcriptional regulator [Selenihalanaerobacter shriftii]SJZ30343.1 transcriptional regulator, TetR family [Selenihalanaerobacter shriftii]
MIEVKPDDIKQKRTLKIFINATSQIVKKEGIEAVTIRKVAKIAGYNSATIYNYFDNRNQLIFFAGMKFISDYVQNMPDYMNQSDDTLERFLLMWECFCKYSFENPQIYYAIFTADIGDRPEDLMQNYYSLFPEEMGNPPEELIPMILETDLSKRTTIAIKSCVKEGYFSMKEAMEIDEMIMLTYQGMLSLLINKRVDYSAEEATELTMDYIRKIVNTAANS